MKNTNTTEKQEKKYPCIQCGKLRTKEEGGTTFSLCDACWDKKYGKQETMEWEKKFLSKFWQSRGVMRVYENIGGKTSRYARIEEMENFIRSEIQAAVQKAREEERVFIGQLKRQWYQRGVTDGAKVQSELVNTVTQAIQKAREEMAQEILKDLDTKLYQIIGKENYQISYEDSHALWNKYLSPTTEKCHCLEALSGGKHHEHCTKKSIDCNCHCHECIAFYEKGDCIHDEEIGTNCSCEHCK